MVILGKFVDAYIYTEFALAFAFVIQSYMVS